jgi:hypothetical protein
VVVELLALVASVAAAVIHAPPPHRPLGAGLRGHVGLGPDDRLDAPGPALLVEVEDPVHVAVVRDPDRGLTVGLGRRDQVVDAGRPIEHGELGVQVQVGESVPHGSVPSCARSG